MAGWSRDVITSCLNVLKCRDLIHAGVDPIIGSWIKVVITGCLNTFVEMQGLEEMMSVSSKQLESAKAFYAQIQASAKRSSYHDPST